MVPSSHLVAWCAEHEVRGEFVVLVEGASQEKVQLEVDEEQLQRHLRRLIDEGMSMRDAVRSDGC